MKWRQSSKLGWTSGTVRILNPIYICPYCLYTSTKLCADIKECVAAAGVHNADHLRANLGHFKYLVAPVPIIDVHLSTRHMIGMKWVKGIKVTAVEQLAAAGVDPRSVGLAIVRLFAELTFVHGYVQKDPRPGNLMVQGMRGKQRCVATASASLEVRLCFCTMACIYPATGLARTILPASKMQYVMHFGSYGQHVFGDVHRLSQEACWTHCEKNSCIAGTPNAHMEGRNCSATLSCRQKLWCHGSNTEHCTAQSGGAAVLRINTVARASSNMLVRINMHALVRPTETIGTSS
eukprot:365296-Chlamydomonas_euryale.AAC.19